MPKCTILSQKDKTFSGDTPPQTPHPWRLRRFAPYLPTPPPPKLFFSQFSHWRRTVTFVWRVGDFMDIACCLCSLLFSVYLSFSCSLCAIYIININTRQNKGFITYTDAQYSTTKHVFVVTWPTFGICGVLYISATYDVMLYDWPRLTTWSSIGTKMQN